MAQGRSRNRGPWFARSSGPSPVDDCARRGAASAARSALLVEARGSLIAAGCVLAVVASLCGALLFFVLCPAPAGAVPTDLQSTDLVGSAKTQVDALTAQAGYVQAEIDELDAQLEGYTESFNQLQLTLTDVNQQLTNLRRDLKTAQLDHAYRVKKYEARICALYKSYGSDEFLALLLASEGIGDFIQRVRLIATLVDQDQRVVDNLSESTDRLNTLLAAIDDTKAEELAVRRQIEDQRAQIEAALADRETTLASIDSEISAIIIAEQKRQQEERDRLQRALAAMLNGGQIYSGPLPQTDSEIVNQFLETAAYYIGIPYVWAGDRPSSGFDCSGYTAYVYAQHGVRLPHYSGYQAQMGYPVSYEDMKPGDLLAFGNPVHHVGIYVGDGLFIHAPRTGDVVSIWELSWKTNLSAIRRFDLQPRLGQPAIW